MNKKSQIIFKTKHINANFKDRKVNAFLIKIITHTFISFCFLSECIFNECKCLIRHQRKHLLPQFLILIRPFIEILNPQSNSMYVLPDNELQAEIVTYSAFIDAITQLDPSIIQLSTPYKIF